MALLTNKTWEVEGTWYAPEQFLRWEAPGVVRAELWNTTSSAGDWDGYFVQKHGQKWYLILFWQENIAWTPYFRLTTDGQAFAVCDHEPTRAECEQLREELDNMMMPYWLAA